MLWHCFNNDMQHYSIHNLNLIFHNLHLDCLLPQQVADPHPEPRKQPQIITMPPEACILGTVHNGWIVLPFLSLLAKIRFYVVSHSPNDQNQSGHARLGR